MKKLPPAVVVLLWIAAALLGWLGLATPAAVASPPSEVVVEDTAGALYRPQLDPALAQISFYEPTKVVVFTRAGSPNDNLNEEVLRFARDRHPEWLSSDRQKWADGLFVIALDTTGRQVGTYFGEDRKVSLDEQAAIQEDTHQLFREAQWTDGVIAGVKSAASRIARPWYLSPAVLITAGVTGLVGLAGAGTWLGVRAWRRKKFAEALDSGDRSYSSVTMRLDETELNASTIPEESTYGALVLERWHSFRQQHREATELRDRLTALDSKGRSGGKNLADARRYEELCQTLDGLDDAIADSNSLLNLDSRWREAWRNQAGDLVEQLDGVETMLAEKKTAGTPETAAALRAGAQHAREEVERLAAGLEERRVSPDDALDHLVAERRRVGELLDRHADAVMYEYAKNEKERDLMRGKLESSAQDWRRGRRTRGSILDIAYPTLPIINVMAYSNGINAGYSAVNSSRSSSQSTGYGSSGGSFSGAGSSSRF
ncbi:DUF5129 domain-containing protein [Sinomonas flava]|uniref:DUF5129 domain-containing protein n=1 Tax=Sinomonas flava TaxID=496857 RepID=UPI0039A75BF9